MSVMVALPQAERNAPSSYQALNYQWPIRDVEVMRIDCTKEEGEKIANTYREKNPGMTLRAIWTGPQVV
jgi:hypothetical protein